MKIQQRRITRGKYMETAAYGAVGDAGLNVFLFFFFFFFISCDKCDPPFFVYLSKDKLMMQRCCHLSPETSCLLPKRAMVEERWKGWLYFFLPNQFFMNVRETQSCPICNVGS
jgi:hypothetical protein